MNSEQGITFEFLGRGEYDARQYIMRFWDGDKTIEIDLTSLAKVAHDPDLGRERGIDQEEE